MTVPGRVNLIGDHVDYCGLPVLPTAIQKSVTLTIRPRADDVIRVASTSGGHEPRQFRIESPLPPFPVGDWGNYVKSAVSALAPDLAMPRGFDALLESTVPPSAGLSSSSAVVVATGLAFLHCNGEEFDRTALAARLAAAERYVGTMGGGMDQAIVLLGRQDHAARIDFEPLRARLVPIPPGWRFVVAHSLVDAHKSGPAQEAYNSRPRQTEAARSVVAGRLGVPDASWRELFDRFDRETLFDVAKACDALHRARFRHVVTEADRVEQAVTALEDNEPAAFGRLMSESHESLRTLFEVSHPALDRLVEISAQAGAEGARLTGAGFGGCIVALTDDNGVEDLLRALRRNFFEPAGVTPAGLDSRLFAVEPADGATVSDCDPPAEAVPQP